MLYKSRYRIMINAYITFNGNCREAMTFYRECLGGELSLQTIGASPLSNEMPSRMKDAILHATLVNENIVLMGSDISGENGVVYGNAVSLFLSCRTKNEIQRLYRMLSKGGKKTSPLQINFWGALFGSLIDPFGNQWLLYFKRKRMERFDFIPK